MEPAGGFEPSTCCLRNSCSTTELRRRGSKSIPSRSDPPPCTPSTVGGTSVAKAYVLIKTRVGEIDLVRAELARNANITSADPIIGPYDIIAVVEASDYNTIGSVVLRFVHELRGVENTVTCMVIESPTGAGHG